MSLILKLSNGVKLMNQHFDTAISATGSDINDINCQITFNYSTLFTRQIWHKRYSVMGQQMNVIRSILYERPFHKTADLFQHPLIGSFLHLKWHKIRVLFFSTLIAYLILVAGITAVSGLSFKTLETGSKKKCFDSNCALFFVFCSILWWQSRHQHRMII